MTSHQPVAPNARPLAPSGTPTGSTATSVGTSTGTSTGTAGAKVSGGEVAVHVRRRLLCDLFPASQIGARHRAYGHQTVQQILPEQPTEAGQRLLRRIYDAVDQIFNQTPRRHRRLAIEDDEFFRSAKVNRLEQARKYCRNGTRLFEPFPDRTKSLSTLLKPTTLSTDPRYVFVQDNSTAPAPTQLKVENGVKRSTAPERAWTFPGSVPVSLMQADIPKLWDGAYFFVWAPKTNGLRFFAVLCTFGHQQMVLLINRAQEVFLLPGTMAPPTLFDGTLLDGELVPTNDGRFAFIAYDCAMSCGVPCSEYNYLVRLQIAGLVIETWRQSLSPPSHHQSGDGKSIDGSPLADFEVARRAAGAGGASVNDVCVVDWRVKRVYSPERFHEMLELELETLDHDTDGFMATAVEPPIQLRQTQTIFKVKRSTDHTIDFMANLLRSDEKAGLLVDLVSMHNRGPAQPQAGVLWDTIEIPADTVPELAKRLGWSGSYSIQSADKWLHGRIVECRYNHDRRSWDVEYVRNDKTTPNTLSTAEKTWKNIQENLSLAQIFPEGSLPDHTRKLLIAWERAHPLWKPNRRPAIDSHMKPTPTFTAPVPLQKLITFN